MQKHYTIKGYVKNLLVKTYVASLPPLVPFVQLMKSLRKALSLELQLNGRLPSKAWLMDGE
jgi:F0F1-type ATP synthase membrane subunit a